MSRIDLESLVGTASRTYKTRQITDDMVASPVHVAIALWDERWDSAVEGKIEGWVIAVDSPTARFVRTGTTKRGNGVARTLAELKKALANTRGRAWVVTGRRQNALRTELERQGYLVTGSFSEKNRAGTRASQLRKKNKLATARKAKKLGEAPKVKATQPVPTTAAHWWPALQSFNALHSPADASPATPSPKQSPTPASTTTPVPAPATAQATTPAPVRIASDASSDTVFKGSMCFVADNGDYQLLTRKTKASVDELELEAITLALKYLHKLGAASAIVETDSVGALEAVDFILAGQRRPAQGRPVQGRPAGANQPGQTGRRGRGKSKAGRSKAGKTWRGIKPGARSRFQQAYGDLTAHCDIDIRRVLGHAGDPLNQAADQIAYMGLRATAHTRQQSQATLEEGIARSLAQAAAKHSAAANAAAARAEAKPKARSAGKTTRPRRRTSR